MLGDAKWLETVRQEAASFYYDESLAAAPASPKVRRALERFVEEVPTLSIKEYVSVYAEIFDKEVGHLASTLAQIARLQHALLHETSINAGRDPAFYESLQHRTQQIMRERQHSKIDDATTVKKLWAEIERLRRGPAAEASQLGVSEEVFAFFGVLQRFLAPGAGEREQRRGEHLEMAAGMLAAIAPELEIIDWNIKEGVQREMRRKLKHVLRGARCPQPVLEPLTAALMRLIHARFGKLAVYRRST
jgi:type I restriction enzyme R subunit